MSETKPIPAIVLNDNNKIEIIEYQWDGKSDKFAMYVEGFIRMPMVHLRSYQFALDQYSEALVYVLADDKIHPDQLATVVTKTSPWFYTYGIRVTKPKPKLKGVK